MTFEATFMRSIYSWLLPVNFILTTLCVTKQMVQTESQKARLNMAPNFYFSALIALLGTCFKLCLTQLNKAMTFLPCDGLTMTMTLASVSDSYTVESPGLNAPPGACWQGIVSWPVWSAGGSGAGIGTGQASTPGSWSSGTGSWGIQTIRWL